MKKVYDGNRIKHLNKNPIMKLFIRNFNREVLRLASLCRPNKILDAGCGEGFTTVEIGKRFPNAKINAFDIDAEKIVYAKNNKQLKNISYATGDIFDIKFKKDSFDLVVCNEVLEHVKDYRSALSNIMKVSRRFVIISVPNEPWFRFACILRLKYLSNFGNHPAHVNNWTKGQFKELLRGYGKILRVRTSGVWNIILLEKY
ncbi:MAG: class I SAM-dependent methyltransferase [archaeon]